MYLYLVQHGEAKKEDEDPARGLTAKGIEDVRKTASFAAKARVKVNRILHSGKTRAEQTANIFGEALKPKEGVIVSGDLAPMDDPAVWAKRIAETSEDTMLVGHLPFMAKLAGLLLCRIVEMTFVDFKMGGIVCLKRLDDGRWMLEWMAVPELIA